MNIPDSRIRELEDSVKEDRYLGNRLRFVRKTTKFVYYTEDGFEKTNKIKLEDWLLIPMWEFRHLQDSFHINKRYTCKFKDGTLMSLYYVSNGIFCRYDNSNKIKNLYNLESLAEVGGYRIYRVS